MTDFLRGALVLAPMTKGSNLPFRRLCQELGADVTMSEMAVARNVVRRKKGELALLRRFEGEKTFGVQLCGRKQHELAEAARMAVDRGADFVDLNCGCPLDGFTSRGLGAALLQQPRRIARLVAAMRDAVGVPVTVKIRAGWRADSINAVEVARRAVEAGAAAIHIHGRTREARYSRAADWDLIGEVQASVEVPVIGNGDILSRRDAEERRDRSGAAGLMIARGALIKPWICDEIKTGAPVDVGAPERVAVYRRLTEHMFEHWGEDEFGRTRIREFLLWHLDFLARYVPEGTTSERVSMQERTADVRPRDALEELLMRSDAAAHAHVADLLMDRLEADPDRFPEAPGGPAPQPARDTSVEG